MIKASRNTISAILTICSSLTVGKQAAFLVAGEYGESWTASMVWVVEGVIADDGKLLLSARPRDLNPSSRAASLRESN
jgi:hypothetical protein